LRQEITNVTANTELMPQVHLIWLESSGIASQAQPGQFVMVHCGEDTLLRRPFSIHQIDGKRLALLFSVVGIGTHWLSQRQAGDSLDLLGPLGNGFSVHPNSKNLLLVAGGIGIAPLVFLAQKASKPGCSITLLLGAQTKSQLYPQKLLPPDVRLITATEDGTGGKKGLVTDLLPDFISWADQVFTCGPPSMYQTMAKQKLLKQKPVQISLEVRMGCGLGVCYGCTVKTRRGLKQVCKDGPIFNLNDVLWEEFRGV
jgi:dihydroorotate dehydrogenase electron transfer subunit